MNAPPIPAAIAQVTRPREELLKYYILRAIATTFAFPLTMLIFYFRYHTMRYRFDTEGIHMAWGIIMRHEIMLNYSRIQDIQLKSNFVERWLGLARIEIQTASGGSDSDMTLEGIPDHEAMREFLYSRMRGAHHPNEQGPNEQATAAPASESLAAILTEIAQELKQIRVAMEQRSA
jgi:putative membrane protein